MRIAIPIRRGRVSPVFDVAKRVLVADVEPGAEPVYGRTWMTHVNGHVRPGQLVEMGVDLLVCDFISSGLEESISSSGIRIIGQVCGSVREIMKALVLGGLDEGDFVSPGHPVRASRYRGMSRGRRNGGTEMPRGDATGPYRPGGRGRRGGPLSAGPGGTCVCPKCGFEKPHATGSPCQETSCPECGTRMMRK
jgi:hypothetical protein